ncbi:MAG: Zn-ribbon domain-containing OB-fold protein [Acidimicrobiales bacterium]
MTTTKTSASNTSASDKPRPLPIEPTKPYWDALAEHRITIPRCDRCSTWVWYPRPRCQSCLSNELTWTTVSGAGTVHTYTVTRQPIHPAFADETPQVQAIVELDEGVRMTTTLIDVDPETVAVGMAVQPAFDDGPDGITLLRFYPA